MGYLKSHSGSIGQSPTTESGLRVQLPTLLGTYSPGVVLKNQAAISKSDGRAVLDLAESISAPADLGAYGVPSAGSVGHSLGMCKPCDFVHRGSCRIGVACQFCHLCGPGEAQRR